MSENREIKVPALGESISEATVARWTKSVGQAVKIDELLLELETDKITLEVTSPADGVLVDIKHPEGTTVTVGQILGLIAVGKVSEQQLESKPVSPAPVVPKVETAPVTPQFKPQSTSLPGVKSSIPSKVTLSNLAPSVRKMVVENDLNPAEIQGTGKAERLTKEDVVEYMTTSTPSDKSLAVPPEPVELDFQPSTELASAPHDQFISNNREERVRMTRLRQRIAQRLKEAQNTAAILTTFNEVDMSAIYQLRNQYKDAFEKKHGVKLGFMSFFVKAALRALKEFPEINAEIDEDTIIYKNYYDIGVAVSAPQGLVVPVLRNAESLSFSEIEKGISELGIRARDGKLGIDEMMGGTFTISNGGIFGSLMSTPIINPPQSGILGMHKIQERPVAINGKVEIRPMMYVALSYDHRLVDGREAVGFLVRIKENIENPERLLLEI